MVSPLETRTETARQLREWLSGCARSGWRFGRNEVGRRWLTGPSPCFQRSQPFSKRPSVRVFHRGEPIFEGIHDDLCEGGLVGPVHCIAKAFHQRYGERDSHPLPGSWGTQPCRSEE